jgi:hypothetical protein
MGLTRFPGQCETNFDLQVRELGVCLLMNTIFLGLSVSCAIPLSYYMKIPGIISPKINICEPSVWNLLNVTILAPIVLRCLTYFSPCIKFIFQSYVRQLLWMTTSTKQRISIQMLYKHSTKTLIYDMIGKVPKSCSQLLLYIPICL